MNERKFNLGMYLFALGCGLCAGLCFSKAAYYKGKGDAYGECSDLLQGTIDKTQKFLDEHAEESE